MFGDPGGGVADKPKINFFIDNFSTSPEVIIQLKKQKRFIFLVIF
jgi:hypothetical protein